MSWLSTNALPILSGLGGTLTIVGTYAAARVTGRQSAKSHKAAVDAAAYESARGIWGDVIEDLRQQVQDQKHSIAELRSSMGGEIRQLRERLGDLETKRAGDRRAIHILTEYAKLLLQVLRSHGIEPPEPPDGLDMAAQERP